MKIRTLIIVSIITCVNLFNVQAYKVWMSTSCAPKNAALKTETWARTAQVVEGLNVNFALCLPSPGTPSENEKSPGNNDKIKILAQVKNASNTIIEVPRSGVQHALRLEKPNLPDYLASRFLSATKQGYEIRSIMFYNNATSINGVRTNFIWTEDEIRAMRNWLDTNGHAKVKLMWNARNIGAISLNWCKHSLVDDILLEAEPEKWYENAGKRQELLKLLVSTKETKDKRYFFQLPLSGFN